MADTTVTTAAKISAGGFLIDIQPDELTARKDKSAVLDKKTSPSRVIFLVLVSLFLVVYLLLVLLPEILHNGATFFAFLALLVVPSVLWAYFSGSKNLHCTRESLEVVQIARGKLKNKWLFPKDVVKNIRFAPVTISKYGAICGIVFTAQGKKWKILHGLESPEADTILKQLVRLGFDVIQDVGMPMMVEMALERRNSSLSL